jgi:hypothetical protein
MYPSTLQMVNTWNHDVNNGNNRGNPPARAHGGASADHAGVDVADYATNHGDHAECPRTLARIAASATRQVGRVLED